MGHTRQIIIPWSAPSLPVLQTKSSSLSNFLKILVTSREVNDRCLTRMHVQSRHKLRTKRLLHTKQACQYVYLNAFRIQTSHCDRKHPHPYQHCYNHLLHIHVILNLTRALPAKTCVSQGEPQCVHSLLRWNPWHN